ncbi:hypothetical protein FRC12_005890 [Ceratobasidium sp. 428]|nr:hypothetical protein FRC12_005890 [Ceratobasidium sp. 428]
MTTVPSLISDRFKPLRQSHDLGSRVWIPDTLLLPPPTFTCQPTCVLGTTVEEEQIPVAYHETVAALGLSWPLPFRLPFAQPHSCLPELGAALLKITRSNKRAWPGFNHLLVTWNVVSLTKDNTPTQAERSTQNVDAHQIYS